MVLRKGAYGFLGRYFVHELGSCGTRTYVPFRGCEMEVRHLKPSFDLGQVTHIYIHTHTNTYIVHTYISHLLHIQLGLLPFSPRDEKSIVASLKHSDIVVNFIGKHYETKHAVPTRRSNGKLSRVNYDFEEVVYGWMDGWINEYLYVFVYVSLLLVQYVGVCVGSSFSLHILRCFYVKYEYLCAHVYVYMYVCMYVLFNKS